MTLAETIARRASSLPRITFRGLVARLIDADRSYQQTRRLESLSDDHLHDMGFTRTTTGAIIRR